MIFAKYCIQQLKLRSWYASSSSSIYWHSNVVASADWLRVLEHVLLDKVADEEYTSSYVDTIKDDLECSHASQGPS